jgi:FixJ family two-component response regulator
MPKVGDEPQPTVVVIDDDADVREALDGLLRSVGLRVELLSSTKHYFERPQPTGPECLVLDIRLPGQSGLDFHAELVKAGIQVPVIFISGHADVPISVRAMKAGAIEFLTKPVRHQDLLDAIQQAINRDIARRKRESAIAQLRSIYENLTAREREVMSLVVAGEANRVIASEFGISEATVKLHRGQVMRKMNAKSLVELVRMADMLQLHRNT